MIPLTILYTANLRGDLDLLPRLYTFIRQLKAQRVEDETDVMLCPVEPPPQKVMLLDLGNSCASEVWHCAATGGRSTLMVLDAMGYHAAAVQLTNEGRERLKANTLTTAVVDENTYWQDDGVLITLDKKGGEALPYHYLRVVLTPSGKTQLGEKLLELEKVNAGQIGMARIDLTGKPRLIAQGIFEIPSGTLPDPTIAATVDFVTDEARYFQRTGSSTKFSASG